ncbi:prohibitin family protein [Zunongwangia sp. SCSIO 43204]|uniref:Regulator of protease activity HflC, stomatin/prohibitin superfamily n=1 Tax=Zunongwangia mangrovi TaxID=1334022 RepID=A0A1I1MNR0_9FLAO|nr:MULTISPECIES: prohibitin family protein [Zunongwangia]UAB83017.1 prohibitin family protein [Zunongwangia sp. SCSIO 43204]SFC83180.1 Regulator of protease activity HflC, stomatin/prohibitin superfamily [Zunongwangia mangrovi]
MERLPKIAIPIFIGLVVLIIFISKSTITIGSGEAGVLYKTFGNGVVIDEPPLNEGFHWVLPWNKVFVYEVRQQSLDEKMTVLSSNGLEIKLDASVWFQPAYDDLGKLHKEKSEAYIERLLKPALRSATRAVVGRYNPEQLYSSKREAIQEEILEETQILLRDQYVQVNEVLVRDVSLPPTIKEAIERKLRQEQESLEYEYRLTKAEQEAERQRIDAEGKARANRILSESLTEKVLMEKGIQATLELAKSGNAKTVIIGSGEDGLPLILGNN